MLNRHSYSAILLTTLFLLHGCSGSSLTDSKEQEIAEAHPPIAGHPPHLADELPVTQTAPAPAKSVQVGRAKGMVLASEVARMAPTALAGGTLYKKEAAEDKRFTASPEFQRESYNALTENPFIATRNDPLSTFSIDVDTASYANMRRWLTGGNLPPVGAVRIEELVNYFNYNYPEPQNSPIGITTELGPCPWQQDNKLVRIGLRAKSLDPSNIPPSNLVFLIDVSGSMEQPNKLPLLQQSMLLLADQLKKDDRVAIVVYAGADHVVLHPTAGDQKETIRAAITRLAAGGSTHASSGIVTAYKLARRGFIKNGNNRIILASDGDFNVGVTSRDELERLVAKERESGVFLTILGFGMGNYHDDTMEILADKGNGNYSYIDSLLEAKKVLIKERSGTLFTLAKDVKLQIEFNPARVGGYRLIGYENRVLADEDFNDDKKDAGEIGAGHTVTALYELLPVGSRAVPKVDPLKYQTMGQSPDNSNEVLNIKLRYKPLDSDKSLLLSAVVKDNNNNLDATSDDFRFASTVAGFGMLLGHSEQANQLDYPQLIAMAQKSRGTDREGYRAEFVHLLEMAELLQNK